MNTPFKLTLEIATPIIMSPVRTTLDGLLSYAIFRETGLKGDEVLPHMPLLEDQGIYKASSLFAHRHSTYRRVDQIQSLDRRSDLSPDLFKPNGRGGRYVKIYEVRGKYKKNLISYRALVAPEIYFWGVGDPERVVQLIEDFIPSIGRKHNSGGGQVMAVRWEEDEDFSWVTSEGKPARQLPVAVWEKLGQDAEVYSADVAVRLPYWTTEKIRAVLPESIFI